MNFRIEQHTLTIEGAFPWSYSNESGAQTGASLTPVSVRLQLQINIYFSRSFLNTRPIFGENGIVCDCLPHSAKFQIYNHAEHQIKNTLHMGVVLKQTSCKLSGH